MIKPYAEIIGDELSSDGWSSGIVEYVRPDGLRMWAVDAHQGNLCPCYIARADSEIGVMLQLKKDVASMK